MGSGAERSRAALPDAAVREAADAGLDLGFEEGRLVLSDGGMGVCGDFARMLGRVRSGRFGRELLVRAARVKRAGGPARAVDATAGLGEDAFLLASAGFEVVMYERNAVVAALLGDALARAALVPELAGAASRMRLVQADSTAALSAMDGDAPDVVLLDPMFPVRQKSAAVKKKLQLLQRLERPCDDEAALLSAALSANPRKVVVKRPAKGPHLAGMPPAYSLAGKAVRYDCYLP